VTAALLADERLELLDPCLFALNTVFGLQGDPVVRVKLFLQLDDCLVSFIESRRESDHDVPLLEQKLFVSVDLGFSLFDLVSFAFYFVEFGLVF